MVGVGDFIWEWSVIDRRLGSGLLCLDMIFFTLLQWNSIEQMHANAQPNALLKLPRA
jgi:hypothetical protein